MKPFCFMGWFGASIAYSCCSIVEVKLLREIWTCVPEPEDNSSLMGYLTLLGWHGVRSAGQTPVWLLADQVRGPSRFHVPLAHAAGSYRYWTVNWTKHRVPLRLCLVTEVQESSWYLSVWIPWWKRTWCWLIKWWRHFFKALPWFVQHQALNDVIITHFVCLCMCELVYSLPKGDQSKSIVWNTFVSPTNH